MFWRLQCTAAFSFLHQTSCTSFPSLRWPSFGSSSSSSSSYKHDMAQHAHCSVLPRILSLTLPTTRQIGLGQLTTGCQADMPACTKDTRILACGSAQMSDVPVARRQGGRETVLNVSASCMQPCCGRGRRTSLRTVISKHGPSAATRRRKHDGLHPIAQHRI